MTQTDSQKVQSKHFVQHDPIIHNRCSRSEEESPAPAMTLSLSHSQHVQTQKGLATQGRGLDNEDLPCFESEKVTTYEKRSQHVPSSYSSVHPSQIRPMR